MVSLADIGLRPYREVLAYQETLRKRRLAGEIADTAVFCEHYPVFTTGKRDSSADFLSDLETIKSHGIEIVNTGRGGRITYHGPGQMIAYFIFDLKELGIGIKDFVRKVEDVCIMTAAEFGIAAVRDKEHPGVWVDDKKLAAVGFHVSNGVTMHGIAVNVAPDMSHFRHIIPCGIADKGVISMKDILGNAPPMRDVVSVFGGFLSGLFN